MRRTSAASVLTVDLNWAKEHHKLWVNEELRKPETATPLQATATGAE
jgi:cytochrome b subunit of formate dehydrogenase